MPRRASAALRIPTPKVSTLEAKWDQAWRLLRPTWAPLPVAEHRFAPPRRWRFDRAFPVEMVAVELEGGAYSRGRHTRPTGFIEDCRKYTAAALAGWMLIRLTAPDLKDPEAAVRLVTQALRARMGANNVR